MSERGQASPRLHEALASFATQLVDRYETADLLQWLVDVAVDVAQVDGCGILLEDVDGTLRYAVASDDRSGRLEGIQLELGAGPCMLAHDTGEPVLVPALADDARFPDFAPRAMQEGVGAVFTFPLKHQGNGIGVLDLYRDAAGELTRHQHDDAVVIGSMITTAVLNRRSLDDSRSAAQHLQSALDARIVLEQAKGRVSEQQGVDIAGAEQVIRNLARDTEQPLGDVVRRIARGDLRPPNGSAS